MSKTTDLVIDQHNKDKWDILLEAIDKTIENFKLTTEYIKNLK